MVSFLSGSGMAIHCVYNGEFIDKHAFSLFPVSEHQSKMYLFFHQTYSSASKHFVNSSTLSTDLNAWHASVQLLVDYFDRHKHDRCT